MIVEVPKAIIIMSVWFRKPMHRNYTRQKPKTTPALLCFIFAEGNRPPYCDTKSFLQITSNVTIKAITLV